MIQKIMEKTRLLCISSFGSDHIVLWNLKTVMTYSLQKIAIIQLLLHYFINFESIVIVLAKTSI